MKKFKKSTAIRKLTIKFSRIIHMRDGERCQRCDGRGTHLHTSHIKSVGAYRHMRFEPLNALLFCFFCHIQWWHHEPTEADQWIKEYLGEHNYNWLTDIAKEKPLMNQAWFERVEEKLDKLENEIMNYR